MLTFLDLYNEITGQAWSMFDGEVESKEEFETTVTTSIQKAISMLWNTYEFPFRKKIYSFKTKENKADYATPNGSIITKVSEGKTVYAIYAEKEYLDYDEDILIYEEKTGVPEKFCIKEEKIILYPTPDKEYKVTTEYFLIFSSMSEDGNQKANLSEDTDYLNIPEKYEDLFKNTILPLAMTYLIASESDENYSAYWNQYKLALDNLLKYTMGIMKDRTIGW